MRSPISSEASKQAAAEAKKLADEQRRAGELLGQQIAQMAQSAIGGLINDLRNGVEAGEAFNNMLNRIIDSLIQMALQSMFSRPLAVFSAACSACRLRQRAASSARRHSRSARFRRWCLPARRALRPAAWSACVPARCRSSPTAAR